MSSERVRDGEVETSERTEWEHKQGSGSPTDRGKQGFDGGGMGRAEKTQVKANLGQTPNWEPNSKEKGREARGKLLQMTS